MVALLTSPGLGPFTFALFVLVGLMLLELGLMLIGLSSHIHIDHPGLHIDADMAEMPELPDTALAEVDPGAGLHAPEPSGLAGALHALGIGEAPAMVWLGALALGFSISGFALQFAAGAVTGSFLATGLAAAIALVPGVFVARTLSRFIGRLVPSVETYATSSFHRRIGRITVGVARAGYPAEVRFDDSYGTTHQLMAEPLDRDEQIPAGTEVMILRDRAGKPRLIRRT
jgi:Inner membrane protein YqiJ, N-terminal/Inner membrane protein YqiJ, OB-fold